MLDNDDSGVIKGCKWELLNIIICIDYQLYYDFEQEILLLIYCGHENDYYLINFLSYYFMANFLIIVLVSLRQDGWYYFWLFIILMCSCA